MGHVVAAHSTHPSAYIQLYRLARSTRSISRYNSNTQDNTVRWRDSVIITHYNISWKNCKFWVVAISKFFCVYKIAFYEAAVWNAPCIWCIFSLVSVVSPGHGTAYILYRRYIRNESRIANSSVDNNCLFCGNNEMYKYSW